RPATVSTGLRRLGRLAPDRPEAAVHERRRGRGGGYRDRAHRCSLEWGMADSSPPDVTYDADAKRFEVRLAGGDDVAFLEVDPGGRGRLGAGARRAAARAPARRAGEAGVPVRDRLPQAEPRRARRRAPALPQRSRVSRSARRAA